MSAYLVTTPKNPAYEGKVFGIQFNAGRAIVSKETISPFLGWSLEQVIKAFQNDFKYEVQPLGSLETPVIDLGAGGVPVPVAIETPAETGKPRRKGAGVKEK